MVFIRAKAKPAECAPSAYYPGRERREQMETNGCSKCNGESRRAYTTWPEDEAGTQKFTLRYEAAAGSAMAPRTVT